MTYFTGFYYSNCKCSYQQSTWLLSTPCPIVCSLLTCLKFKVYRMPLQEYTLHSSWAPSSWHLKSYQVSKASTSILPHKAWIAMATRWLQLCLMDHENMTVQLVSVSKSQHNVMTWLGYGYLKSVLTLCSKYNYWYIWSS